jgi:hypothetical protein
MDDTSATTATLDQADEDILTYTVSDEALEAAAGTEGGSITPCTRQLPQTCLLLTDSRPASASHGSTPHDRCEAAALGGLFVCCTA